MAAAQGLDHQARIPERHDPLRRVGANRPADPPLAAIVEGAPAAGGGLGEPLGGGTWAMRVHVKPFVRWIWGGALLMMLGGLVTATDRRFARAEARRNMEASA